MENNSSVNVTKLTKDILADAKQEFVERCLSPLEAHTILQKLVDDIEHTDLTYQALFVHICIVLGKSPVKNEDLISISGKFAGIIPKLTRAEVRRILLGEQVQ